MRKILIMLAVLIAATATTAPLVFAGVPQSDWRNLTDSSMNILTIPDHTARAQTLKKPVKLARFGISIGIGFGGRGWGGYVHVPIGGGRAAGGAGVGVGFGHDGYPSGGYVGSSADEGGEYVHKSANPDYWDWSDDDSK